MSYPLKSYKLFNSLSLVVIVVVLSGGDGVRVPRRPTTTGRNSRQLETVTDNPLISLADIKKVLGRNNENPVSLMTTPEAISFYGYPVESHTVRTEDGYFLTMHRIPFGKNGRGTRGTRPVVFLQHGLFGSSFEWLMNKEKNILPFRLVDAGYQVWFGNNRGNTYSRQHVNITVKSSGFFEFSMNEMGKYDLPAQIDYVLKTTGQAKLHYIGFSMGTSTFFIMMSHRPEYNAKVKLMTALAPVVYINHLKGLPRKLTLLETIPEIKEFLQTLLNGEFIPPWMTKLYQYFGTKFCSNKLIASVICTNINFLYAGWDKPQVELNQIPVFYGHTPAPTSVRTVMHILQFISQGIFRQYDFGKTENLRRYGRRTPPNYSLKNTTVPVALLYGLNDAVVNPVDVKRLARELPNCVLNSPIRFPYWNHFDYHLAKDADKLVNERVLKLLASYN